MSDVLRIKKITQFEASNWRWGNRNQPLAHFPIEPHHQILSQPEAKQTLYKVIPKEYFDDMVKNNYLYFNRVDTYEDDKADGEQLPLDRPQNQQLQFSYGSRVYKNGIWRYFTVEDYHDQARSRAYACCMSLEFLEHMKKEYGKGSPVCLEFPFTELRNTLNETIEHSSLICEKQQVPQIFSINYGLVEYVSKKSLRSSVINPIKYLYMKDDSYQNEREFRITLSVLGLGNFGLVNGRILDFKRGMKFPFDWNKAFNDGWTKKVC